MKQVNLNGTITALITPFTSEGSVDFDKLKQLIEFQIDNGVEGILVCGSTGESATLTSKEKQAIIVKAAELVNGRVSVIAGTGTNETQSTLAMSLFAKEHGADAILLVAPYYNKPTQDGLFEHYRLIADNVDIAQILYNVPGRTGINIAPQTQLRIAEACPNVIATKEASGNLEQMMHIIQNSPEHFQLLSGDDALTIPIISIGGTGIVSVISNYAPKIFSDMVRLALDGNFPAAMEIHYRLFRLMQLNFIESNPIPVKTILSIMNKCEDVFRLPMLPIQKENKELLKHALKDAGII